MACCFLYEAKDLSAPLVYITVVMQNNILVIINIILKTFLAPGLKKFEFMKNFVDPHHPVGEWPTGLTSA
jgi:hypothetical protein